MCISGRLPHQSADKSAGNSTDIPNRRKTICYRRKQGGSHWRYFDWNYKALITSNTVFYALVNFGIVLVKPKPDLQQLQLLLGQNLLFMLLDHGQNDLPLWL